ncbi:hypothetical protein [Paraburkholderia oxyphila]|uniref:hypothetical protein n=1 Tax=Paraburkholderia oxyphila TaxID=614212 RepID=UPI000AFBD65D|nr:hypothetical protein [Paraburkholderia oxyphila]
MEAKRPTCVITLYDEETQTISYHHVAQSAVAAAIGKSASFDVPLADFGHKVDDEFARKLGVMILLILAGRSPSLKSQLAITTSTSGDSEPPTT